MFSETLPSIILSIEDVLWNAQWGEPRDLVRVPVAPKERVGFLYQNV